MKRFREEKGLFRKKFPDFKMSMNSKALQGVKELRIVGRRDQESKVKGLTSEMMSQ